MSGAPDPDEALIAGVGRGDPASVRALVSAKLPRMTALAYRMLGDANEAQDIAQEVFVRVWRQAATWRPGPAKFDTWMHRVALNLCYDRLRKKGEIGVDVLPDREDDAPGPDAGLMAADIGARVAAALASLPDRQREAVVLAHYQELGNIEAAALMEVSVEALESLLSRARRSLRAALADLRAP